MSDNNIKEHTSGQKTGMNCPRCGAFIETSIFQLLTASVLVCPSCNLRLQINRIKSQKAFEILRKVQTAKDNLEQKSKFKY